MSFDRLAPHYRWMEFVLAGGRMQRCRLQWLEELRDCRKVLIVGEGPGRFLEVCARELPAAHIVCVDGSRTMLDRARASWRRAGGDPNGAEFIHATLPEWRPPTTSFDLIVTHFFLDCFPEPTLSRIVESLASAARPGARWLLSDFQIPSSGFGRLRARAVLSLAYGFFRVATRLPATQLIPPDPSLERNGFQLQYRRTFDRGLLHSDLWVRNCEERGLQPASA